MDGQGVDELLDTAEELLHRTLDVDDDRGVPLYAVGEIIGNGGHEGIQLPDLDGDAPTTYELIPLTHTGAGGESHTTPRHSGSEEQAL